MTPLPRKIILVVAILQGALTTGCVSFYNTRPGALTPALATIPPTERSAVWQRAIPVLLDEGYVPQVVNEASGYISARRREDLVEDSSLVGTMVTVVVTANGTVRLEVSGTGFYHSQQEFQAAVDVRQKRLLDRILNQTAATSPPPSNPPAQ